MKYVLGVDGDNLYTRYFLFSPSGNLTGYLFDNTCSQEIVGFDGATGILRARIQQLLNRHHISVQQLVGVGMGLAGVDSEKQQRAFEDFFHREGIENVRVTNDCFLGLYSGTSRGVGICILNGNGCATSGINEQGQWLQVGGLGEVTGDDGGGGFLAVSALRKVYASFFRCGEETLMTPSVFAQLGIDRPEEMQSALIESQETNELDFVRIVFAAAELGDHAALDILRHVAHEQACNAAGCIRYLGFTDRVEVVLAGGLWRKAENELLYKMFEKELKALSPAPVCVQILQSPIALGAVMLALSECGIDPFEEKFRQRLCAEVTEAIENDRVEFYDR